MFLTFQMTEQDTRQTNISNNVTFKEKNKVYIKIPDRKFISVEEEMRFVEKVEGFIDNDSILNRLNK